MILNREQIKEFLPHREPFVFVDTVEDFVPRKRLRATLYLDALLPFFKGHFPNNPIMPGVLIVESLAQSSGLLLALTEQGESSDEFKKGSVFYLASNNVKFTGVAKAGDTLELETSLTRDFGGLYHFGVSANCGRRKVAEGSLVLASPKNVER